MTQHTRMTHHSHMAKHDQRPLVTITDAAERIGVSRSTVMRRVRNGDLEYALKVPGDKGAYLLDPDVVEAERLRVQTEREQALARSLDKYADPFPQY